MKMKRILATAVAMIVAISIMPNLSMVAHAARATGNCPDCGGDGLIECTSCDGSGSIRCTDCEGEGVKDCVENHNDSRADDAIICSLCHRPVNRGAGTVDCDNCETTGSIDCSECLGNGGSSCSTCGGTGSIPEASADDTPEDTTPEDTTPAIVYVPSVATKSVVINDAKAANLEKFCIQGAPDSYLAPVVQGLMEKTTTVAPASVKCEVTTALPQEITSYLEKNQNVTIYVKYTDGSYIPVKGSVLARLPKVPWYGPELLKSLFGTVNAAQVK